ncbi:MAG: asparagine synthase (glutamine-hydrolyzing) [Minisyncoccia bacterium]
MCGILGCTPGNPRFGHALETIRHRGPDMGGESRDGFDLGFNRLAIIDTAERANQPMWDSEHKLCIVFNGEIYNFQELKRDLEKEFHFTTASDTEVLLYGHKKYGAAFAKKLRGMYAYAVYDSSAQTVTVVRDHAGIKPLYYFFDDTTFAFASEMKALVALMRDSKSPEIDHDAIRLFWAFGYIPSPKTQYKNFFVLPRSSFLTFDISSKEISITGYNIDTQPVTTEHDLFDLIEKKVIDHLVADVPVGLFFSGGTDSTVIANTLKKNNQPLETFSIRVAGRPGDEPYFRALSTELGLNSHVYDFGPSDFNEIYDDVMGKMDIPLVDTAIFPTYFVSKKAREKVTVVLSGEGGDELFFGYPRQQKLRAMRTMLDAQLTTIDKAANFLPHFPGRNRILTSLQAHYEPISFYLREMSPVRAFLTNEFLAPAKRFVAENARDPLYFDRDLYLENMLLRKTDLATMFNSLEGRVPLLDPDIIASASHFESSYDGIELKPLLKKMLKRDLPHELVYRKKSGFGMDLSVVLGQSDSFLRDLTAALEYFRCSDVPAPHFPDQKALRDRANAAFAIVALYRALTC